MLYDTARACRSLERGPSIPRFLKTNRVIGTAIGCIDERHSAITSQPERGT